ncbi:YicC/YloC family endoribonuclease [Brevibacillus invocatus]
MRKLVAQSVRRGRAEVNISVEEERSTASSSLTVDWSVAEQFVLISREMNERFSLNTPLTAKDLLLLPGVIHTEDSNEKEGEDISEWILALVESAAQDLSSMKIAEGNLLEKDLTNRLSQIRTWIDEIREHVPQVSEEYRNRLQQRIAEMLSQVSFEWEPQRMAQELAFFAEKSDISEEVIRLQSHCLQFAEQLEQEEAIGRKLDFLLQEMNREANTIASKANHLHIQHLAVEIKTELEKMREQVQNIE